ncbi:MAG: DUF6241 domain-containing protein, partial [Peptostreptococcaceae bacterium]
IKDVSIYSAVELKGIENLKVILNDIDIEIDTDINSDQEMYETIKENIEIIENSKEIAINKDINIELYIKEYIKKSRILKICISSIITLLMIIGIFVLIPHYAYYVTPFGNIFNSIHNEMFNKTAKKVNYNIESTTVEEPKNKKETILLIHHMSNTLIIAKDNNAKHGFESVNPGNIKIAIEAVRSHMKDEKLIKMLDRWNQGDFYNATIVHNYVWSMLNGEIGYAVAIDEGKVKGIVDTYYK